MRKLVKSFVRDERGVSAMEYAILAGIVAVALAGIAVAFNGSVTTMFNTMFSSIANAQAQ
jgi:pilus assembly protein Flp/PilA